jgi:glycerophosphoryl diester phosphodiesterase
LIENRFRAWYRARPGRPLVLAHRGDSFRAPENTLEAAQLGFEAGADGWEIDVRLTREGIPVVLHDESLRRTTDVDRRFAGDPRADSGFLVSQFTLDEIRTLDAGSWFVDSIGPRSARGFGTFDGLAPADRAHYGSGRVRVPTLAEALAVSADRDRLVNVEIKPTTEDVHRLVGAVLDEIRGSGVADLASISSFDHDVVALVVARAPDLAIGALVGGPIDRPAREFLGSLGADALHAPPSGVDLTDPGASILVYTVNDAGPGGLAEQLAEAGVAGLFTDDPTSLSGRFGISPSSGHTRSHSDIAGHRGDVRSGDSTPPTSR